MDAVPDESCPGVGVGAAAVPDWCVLDCAELRVLESG